MGSMIDRRLRLADLALGSLLTILVLPVFAVLVITNYLLLGRPIFYIQTRTGKALKSFQLIKFRSMKIASAPDAKDGSRLTYYGTLIRYLSLDELPSLYNVLKGDMSLVGPRPLLPEYNSFYTDKEKTRFAVSPGVTGLAQIRGRNEISWSRRLRYDVWFVEHRSLNLYLYILSQTFISLVLQRDISLRKTYCETTLLEERSK